MTNKEHITRFERRTALLVMVSFAVGAISGFAAGRATPTNNKCETTTLAVITSTEQVNKEVEEHETSETEKIYYSCPLSFDLQEYITAVCMAADVPVPLVLAIIEVESSFQADAVSETDDYGLMQINKINHEQLSEECGITDFLDPKQNVSAGVYLLSQHLEVTDGDMVSALMRYNNGVAGAKKLQSEGIYSTSYTDKVMTAYENYKK